MMLIANQDILDQPSRPVFSNFHLQTGSKYRMRLETCKKTEGHYLGENIAFGCACCGKSSGFVNGYFFASGNLKRLGRTNISVIPEHDINFNKNGYVKSDGGVLIREYTLNILNLRNILTADEREFFYGHLSMESIQRMFRESRLVIEQGN